MKREMSQVRCEINYEHQTLQLIQDDLGGSDAIVSLTLDQLDAVCEWFQSGKEILKQLREQSDSVGERFDPIGTREP